MSPGTHRTSRPRRVTPGTAARLRILALAILLASSGSAAIAQDWTKPRSGDAASRSFERPPKADGLTDAQAGDQARARMDARQRDWDRKMKAVGQGICSGC